MRRLRGIGAMLALALAAILPLEQAHCAWMGLQARPAAAASAAGDHACCAGRSADTATPAPECLCIPLPVIALPGSVTVPPAAPAAALLAFHAEALLAPPSRPEGIRAPAEVGSPPLSVDPGAHGLRAPPAA